MADLLNEHEHLFGSWLEAIRGREGTHTCTHTQIPSSSRFHTTHIASDHNIKADGVSFVQCSEFSPFICLEVFGKSENRERKKWYENRPRATDKDKDDYRKVTKKTERRSGPATWSCSLWRRHSWQKANPVVWKSIWVYNTQLLGPGYTSIQCLSLFLHPEGEKQRVRLYPCLL